MKKLILSAAIALFAVSGFAQSKDSKYKREPKEQTSEREKKDKVKKDKPEREDNEDMDKSVYDVNRDGIFSPEEKEARKTDKMARKEARKAERELDRDDDGLLNGSHDKDNHGRDVSRTARGTEFEGREKGKTVSDVARSNGKSRDRMEGSGNTNKPAKVGRPAGMGKPAGSGKPAGVGKPAGAGRKMK